MLRVIGIIEIINFVNMQKDLDIRHKQTLVLK